MWYYFFDVNMGNNTDIDSHILVLGGEDGKHESPHCDTDTMVQWKTFQQRSGSPACVTGNVQEVKTEALIWKNKVMAVTVLLQK